MHFDSRACLTRRYLRLSNLRNNTWMAAGQIKHGVIDLQANIKFPKAVTSQDQVRAVWLPVLLDYAEEDIAQRVREHARQLAALPNVPDGATLFSP